MAQLTDDCFAFSGPLLPVDEVERIIRQRVTPVVEVETVPLHAADGRVLAGDVLAPIDLPPFDNSAVDGYAVRHMDLHAKDETRLTVVERVTAGRAATHALGRGAAARIFTGAPMPPGADTVFMQEDVRRDGDAVIVPAGLKSGANRRLAGEDLRAGSIALPAGRRLAAQHIALAAAIGLTALDVSLRSFIVPDAPKRLRLTNNGGDSVQVELIFTPSGSDGFDATAVKRVVIVVPPNDVVTLVDPVSALFGATVGQIEARIPRERLGLILVSASIPVVARGEGARVGAPHVIYMPPAAATITLAETSGFDKATVRLVSDSGQTLTQDIPRYGMKRISVNSASRWDINVDSGGGSVVGLAAVGTFTVLSRPATDRVGATSLASAFWKSRPAATAPSVTTVVPVISGSSSAGNAPSYRVAIGLVAQSSAAQFFATFYPSTGAVTLNRTINVAAGATTVYNDVMRDLFAVTPADGNLFLQGPPNSKVYAVLQQTTSGGSVPASSLPLPTTLSEAVTSAASSSQRPL